MKYLPTFILALATLCSYAQTNTEFSGFPTDYTVSPKNKQGIRIMFYNLENLFDPENDSLKNDEAFTPEGSNHYTPARYREKLEKTYKVIASVGGWEPPAIVGFCELENRKVIHELITTTPLARYNYGLLHEESADPRGIDVALIYRRDKFKPFSHVAHKIIFDGQTQSSTRDVLMVGGTVNNEKDTLFVFVNHWPSKYGGAKETEEKRMHVARQMRKVCDSLMLHHPQAGIILMGDFNDEPQEPSLMEGLKTLLPDSNASTDGLYNLMLRFKDGGTHKFQSTWSMIDQFIVRGNMLGKEGMHVIPQEARIFKADFLIVPDETNLGDKPNRTYIGMQYNGGFSDHLPIYLDVWFR